LLAAAAALEVLAVALEAQAVTVAQSLGNHQVAGLPQSRH
jgi:hypothetical protein